MQHDWHIEAFYAMQQGFWGFEAEDKMRKDPALKAAFDWGVKAWYE